MKNASTEARPLNFEARNAKCAMPSASGIRKSRVSICGSSGYLLLEVLLALAVLSLVVVMIFQIIHTTLQATAGVNFLQMQQEKVDGICELLRRNIVEMPQSSQFQTRYRNNTLELIFRNAPFTFSWGNEGAQFGTIVISGRPQPDGRLALSVLQDARDASESYVDAGKERNSDWFPLTDDLEQITWRFFSGREAKWLPDWSNPGTKPSLIELTFKLAGRNHMERAVFTWPIALNSQ
jgi:type II secretory pathway component PulJ